MSGSDTLMIQTPISSGVRTPGQIRQQLKQVLFRHLQREIREALKRTPEACRYNQAANLKGIGPVHLCQYVEDSKPRKVLCDSRMWGGSRQARNCPMWDPKRSKDMIKADFRALIASGDRGRIATKYPDVAALMWVLDGVDVTQDLLSAEVEADRDIEDNPPVQELDMGHEDS